MHCYNLLTKFMNRLSATIADYTIGVFIDLSKAFDTVYHNILLKKIEIYGISSTHLQWF